MAKINFDISKRLDITVRQGDSFKLELTLKDSSGNALNLYDDKFHFQVSRFVTGEYGSAIASPVMATPNYESSAIAMIPMTASITDDESTTASTATGKVKFEASAADMQQIPANTRMIYDVQYVDMSAGEEVDGGGNARTILFGDFIVKQDYTHVAE
tara:strand:+ start:121 stop:591 length:471 start_codon:yes stop_codon:yes gene_type:complete